MGGGAQEAFAKLDMEHYDDDDEDKARVSGSVWLSAPWTDVGPHAQNVVPNLAPPQVGTVRLFGSGPLTVFKDNKDDPYLTLPDSDEESERDDFVIRTTGARAPLPGIRRLLRLRPHACAQPAKPACKPGLVDCSRKGRGTC